MNFDASPGWSFRTKRLVVLGAIGLGVFAVWWLAEILPIVIVAMVLAYLLTPLVTFIEDRILTLSPLKRLHSRGLAVFCTFMLVLALFLVIILVVVPTVVGQLEEFGRNLPATLTSLEKQLEQTLSEPVLFNGEPVLIEGKPFVPLERLLEATGASSINDLLHLENFDLVGTAQTFISSLGSVTGPAFGFLGDAVTTLINFIFLVVMMFYLMKDGELFAHKLIEITPDSYEGDMHRLLQRLAEVWNAYLRGQIVISVMTGTLIFAAALLLGMRSALILGLFSGILQLIPNIGPLLAIIPAAILALVSGSSTFPALDNGTFLLIVIIVWVVIQNFVLFVMVPRIMGSNLDLHPFVIIVAVIAGASVAGALGIILSVPFVASARILGQYVYGKLMDRDPFPVRTRAPYSQPRWQRWGNTLGHRLAARARALTATAKDTPPKMVKEE